MAIRTDFTAGEVLAAADLNDTFGAKLNIAGGKILQIVRATDSTTRSTSSSSLVDVTGMSVTITPQLSTSAILVFALFTGSASVDGDDANAVFVITDSSNNAVSGGGGRQEFENSGSTPGGQLHSSFFTLIGRSTPATTSAVTYKLRFRIAVGAIAYVQNGADLGQMYAMEVSA
jgi:hypothetical protein